MFTCIMCNGGCQSACCECCIIFHMPDSSSQLIRWPWAQGQNTCLRLWFSRIEFRGRLLPFGLTWLMFSQDEEVRRATTFGLLFHFLTSRYYLYQEQRTYRGRKKRLPWQSCTRRVPPKYPFHILNSCRHSWQISHSCLPCTRFTTGTQRGGEPFRKRELVDLLSQKLKEQPNVSRSGFRVPGVKYNPDPWEDLKIRSPI